MLYGVLGPSASGEIELDGSIFSFANEDGSNAATKVLGERARVEATAPFRDMPARVRVGVVIMSHCKASPRYVACSVHQAFQRA